MPKRSKIGSAAVTLPDTQWFRMDIQLKTTYAAHTTISRGNQDNHKSVRRDVVVPGDGHHASNYGSTEKNRTNRVRIAQPHNGTIRFLVRLVLVSVH